MSRTIATSAATMTSRWHWGLAVAMLAAMMFVAGCQQQAAPQQRLPSGLAGYDPHLVESRKAQCEAEGGRFGEGGLSGTLVCYQTNSDANQSCSRESDCEGLCLARSRTCSPIRPLLGCNEVLTETGLPTVLCIE